MQKHSMDSNHLFTLVSLLLHVWSSDPYSGRSGPTQDWFLAASAFHCRRVMESAHRKSTHRMRKVGYRGKEWQNHVFTSLWKKQCSLHLDFLCMNMVVSMIHSDLGVIVCVCFFNPQMKFIHPTNNLLNKWQLLLILDTSYSSFHSSSHVIMNWPR